MNASKAYKNTEGDKVGGSEQKKAKDAFDIFCLKQERDVCSFSDVHEIIRLKMFSKLPLHFFQLSFLVNEEHLICPCEKKLSGLKKTP